MEKVTVALGGDSLVLAGVARSLESDGRFKIVTTDIREPGIETKLEAACARALIVDLSVVNAQQALELLHRCHDLTLVGLDPGGGQLVAVSSERTQDFGMDDLIRLIDLSVGAAPS